MQNAFVFLEAHMQNEKENERKKIMRIDDLSSILEKEGEPIWCWKRFKKLIRNALVT